MADKAWKIGLLGSFRVEDPSGNVISIRSRKGRALVALLALNDGVAIPRESLFRDLWPGRPLVNQQQSLRQAIKEVRESFAPAHAIEADRENCRLVLEGFVCDALECLHARKDPGKELLLPEMTEPVFDSYRAELASHAPTGELGDAVRGAAALLEWNLFKDPPRALEVLHSCRDLVPSLPLPLVEQTLRMGIAEIDGKSPLVAWARNQLAIVLMWMGRSEEGIAAARESLKSAKPEVQTAEWIAAVYAAAILLVFRGRFEKARKVLAEAIEVANSLNLAAAVVRFRHGEALAAGYAGDFADGAARLKELSKTDEGQPNWTLREIHRASFVALAESGEKARPILERAKEIGSGMEEARVESQMRVAEAYTLKQEGNFAAARNQFEDLLKFTNAYGLPIVSIHAIEGLATLESEPSARQELVDRAMELRERHRFPLLPGDRIRLGM